MILGLSTYAEMSWPQIAVNLSISLGAGAISAFILAIDDYLHEQMLLKRLVRKYKRTVLSIINMYENRPGLHIALQNVADNFRDEIFLYSGSAECDDFLAALGACINNPSSDEFVRNLRREASNQRD